MRGNLAVLLVLAASVVPASACAMSAAEESQARCRVVGADKLPAKAGGADAICAAVERAVASRAPGVRFTADVKVVSSSMLAANLVVNGRALPEQKFAVMDRELGQSSINRFASSLAAEVAKAARP